MAGQEKNRGFASFKESLSLSSQPVDSSVITKNMNPCLLLEMKPFHMLSPEVGYSLTRGGRKLMDPDTPMRISVFLLSLPLLWDMVSIGELELAILLTQLPVWITVPHGSQS